MSEIVYHVPNRNGGNRRYHTDRECVHLNTGHKILEKEKDRLAEHFLPCKFCQGYERKGPTKESMSMQKMLRESDPEDVGLSPMGGRDA